MEEVPSGDVIEVTELFKKEPRGRSKSAIQQRLEEETKAREGQQESPEKGRQKINERLLQAQLRRDQAIDQKVAKAQLVTQMFYAQNGNMDSNTIIADVVTAYQEVEDEKSTDTVMS
eukprot:CAMPEP_0174251098 /NCGR_PEP_ID=MMETSP0439-20130205/1042_1 /TAXON_ID=0 /ORGANISM="Stereomyxa ramosa, Strain Chinc5" /LENGTH=116 /DNA_ID=CAMNT_0015331333 /DNA_START=30 /DNA_END=380 /DNA_ORIENTATION=-